MHTHTHGGVENSENEAKKMKTACKREFWMVLYKDVVKTMCLNLRSVTEKHVQAHVNTNNKKSKDKYFARWFFKKCMSLSVCRVRCVVSISRTVIRFSLFSITLRSLNVYLFDVVVNEQWCWNRFFVSLSSHSLLSFSLSSCRCNFELVVWIVSFALHLLFLQHLWVRFVCTNQVIDNCRLKIIFTLLMMRTPSPATRLISSLTNKTRTCLLMQIRRIMKVIHSSRTLRLHSPQH